MSERLGINREAVRRPILRDLTEHVQTGVDPVEDLALEHARDVDQPGTKIVIGNRVGVSDGSERVEEVGV